MRLSEIVPVRDIGEMRGFLAGIDTRLEREPAQEPQAPGRGSDQ